MVSYPGLKQRALRLTAANLPVATVKNRRDMVIIESMLAEQALFIQDLSKVYGFKKIRVFGYSFGCVLGIQKELNLIVDFTGDSSLL